MLKPDLSVALEKAKEKYPCSVIYQGKISEQEFKELNEKDMYDIKCAYVRMEANDYRIRYKK